MSVRLVHEKVFRGNSDRMPTKEVPKVNFIIYSWNTLVIPDTCLRVSLSVKIAKTNLNFLLQNSCVISTDKTTVCFHTNTN